jgi:maltose alpha-D-glucosyltransferase/alpha-amylase
MRLILAVRREFPVLGTGKLEVVSSANPSVLAFVRSAPHDPHHGPVNPVLCVHNLSRLAQPAEIHVEQWAGRQPIELLGRVAFPLVGPDPYPITLAPYGSTCFELA